MRTVPASVITDHKKTCHSNLISGYRRLFLLLVSVIAFSYGPGDLNNPRIVFPVPALYCALAPAHYRVSAKSRSPTGVDLSWRLTLCVHLWHWLQFFLSVRSAFS
jgi:hypothetical protein